VFHRNGHQGTWFDDGWKSACARAGIPGRLVHDLRRSAVRNLVRAVVPDVVAMTLTGHKTRSVFDRYNLVSSTDQVEAVRKLAQLHSVREPESWRVVALGDGREQMTGTLRAQLRAARMQSRAQVHAAQQSKLASPTMPSWNQLAGWLRSMDALRKAVGWETA
jgi:hypothetical protein